MTPKLNEQKISFKNPNSVHPGPIPLCTIGKIMPNYYLFDKIALFIDISLRNDTRRRIQAT